MLERNSCPVTENQGECGVLGAKTCKSVEEKGAVSCVEGRYREDREPGKTKGP